MTAPLTVFDTGEVLEPQVYPDQSGWVDFDNDESCSILKIQVSPSKTDPDNTTVINFDSFAGGLIAVEREGTQVWIGEAYGDAAEDETATTTRTVADLDGTADAADWIRSGHVLDDNEVAYLRSLVLPGQDV